MLIRVVYLETRIEKRKKIRKEKRKNFYKFMIISFCLVILYFGIKIVNESIAYLGYIENPSIFKFKILDKRLDLFGERYYIDLRILKKND